MAQEHLKKLDYSNRPPIWHQRRSIRYLLAVSVIGVALGLMWWAWKSSPGEWIRFSYWLHRCEQHSPRSGLPAYSIDPAVIPRMLAGGPDYFPASDGIDAFFSPEEWKKIHRYQKSHVHFVPALIFLHQRTQPSGADRLVTIRIGRYASHPSFVDATSTTAAVASGQKVVMGQLGYEIFKPSSGTHFDSMGLKMTTTMVLPSPEQFSLFDGMADPVDPSRFTIAYKLRGQDGAIEGRLQNDDSVTLQVLNGPLVLYEPDYPFAARARATGAATPSKN